MSNRGSTSENLVLDDSKEGVVIPGITDATVAAKSGLADDEIVAATIHLDKLNKQDVMKVLKVLEPYEDRMKVLTKKDLDVMDPNGAFGLGPAKMLSAEDMVLDDSTEAPALSLGSLNGVIDAVPGLDGKIGGPTVNGDIPGLHSDSLSANADGTITMPSARLTGPDIKTNLDSNFTAPNVSVPSAQLNTPTASLKTSKPEIKGGNYKAPKFAMPHFNLPQIKRPKASLDASADVDPPSFIGNTAMPDLNLSAPQADLKGPNVNLNGPEVDLNGADVNLGTPHADIKGAFSNIKWPHLNRKDLKVKRPDADLNADVSVPTANIDAADLDINLPKADIKTPDLKVQSPDIDINKPSGKFTWPHTRWGKPKLHGAKGDLDLDANLNTPDVDVSVPQVEADINAPDVDFNLPKANLAGPDVDVKSPNIDTSHGVNWFHLKKRKGKIQLPKTDLDMRTDLNTPDLNLSANNGLSAELDIPDADLKDPHLDVQAPNINVEPLKTTRFPKKWKLPKLHGPKTGLKTNVNTPDVDVDIPAVDVECRPDVDLTLPKGDLDVKAPEGPTGKIKLPTIKKPTFHFSRPKVNTPDVDLDANVKAPGLNASLESLDIDPNLPKADMDIKTPNAEIKSPSIKWPTFKKPKLLVPDPKVQGPDFNADVSAPDLNLSAPKLDLPNAELDGPKVDVNAPDIDVDAPSKFKWFNFKSPKFGTWKGPKAELDADVTAPDASLPAGTVNLSAPKLDGGIESPDLNVTMPNADIKTPSVDLDQPHLNGTNAHWKFPKIKIPKLKGPKVKSPDLEAEMKTPDIDASFDVPDADVDMPKVDLKSNNISLSAPKIDSDLQTPDLDVDFQKPDIDLQTSDIDASAGKLKLPKMKMPKFNFAGPKVKEPTIDVDSNVKTPTLSLDAKMPKADITTGDLNLKTPELNTSAPKLDTGINLPDITLPKSSLKGPELNFPQTDLQGPELDSKAPNVNLPSANIDGNISTPNIDVKLPKADLDGPNVTVGTPDLDMNLSKHPNAGLKGPDIDLSHPKLPHFNLPNLDLSGPRVDTPNIHSSVDTSVKSPIATLDAIGNIPAPAVDLKVPGGNIKGPQVNAMGPDATTSLKMPTKSVSKSKSLDFDGILEDGVDSDVSNQYEFPAFKYHTLPRNSIDVFGGLAEGFSFSRQNSDEKDYVVSKGIRLPVLNARQRDGEKIDIMERLKMAKEKISSVNVASTESDLKVEGGTFEVERPKGTLSLGAPEISSTDENDKFSLGLSNMLGLNSQD